MDNRQRFLYYLMAELRGRVGVARAGDGKPGASAGGAAVEKPRGMSRWRDAERKEVAKRARPAPGKAAMAHKVPVP